MKKGVVIIIFLAVIGYLARDKVKNCGPVQKYFEKSQTATVPAEPDHGKAPDASTPATPPPTDKTPIKVSDSAASIAAGVTEPEVIEPPKETLGEIEKMLKGGNKTEAWGKLTRKLLTANSDAERDAIKNALTKLNEGMFFSKESEEGAEFYAVQSGDSLFGIARKFGVPAGLIVWASGKPNKNVRAGERLKIPKGRVKLLVDKSELRLYVLLNNCYLKDYPVGIGKDNKTPVGTFIIKTKIENPPWYAPDGKVYAAGDEKNILGSRWMGFEETSKHSGYGIHGTSLPERVGKAESAGCICMLNTDVEDVFDVVSRGTEAVIRE